MNFLITIDVGLSFIIIKKAKFKNKLRHKKIISTSVMSPSFPSGWGRPFRVRTPLMKHLKRAMVVAVAATLMHRIEAKVVEVELVSMLDR